MRLSMVVSADKESTERTIVFQKEDRIVPVTHLVERRPEMAGKPHHEEHRYIGPFNGGLGDADL
jgi:hypothetical protein